MKNCLVALCLLMLVSWSTATFGPWTEKPLAIVLQPENGTKAITSTITPIDPELDRAMSDELSNTTTESDVLEEESSEKQQVKPVRCIKSSFFEAVRQVKHQVRVLYHWTVSLLTIPLVFLRDSIINLYTRIGDAIFTTLGYVEPECRYKVICEMSAVMSSYIPSYIQGALDNNLNSLIGIASRAKLLNADSEYIQAAFVGSMEKNCTIYEDAKC